MNLLKSPGQRFVFAVIGIAALSRLVPHEYNFSPIGAIALFAGTYVLNRKLAFLVPLITLLVSDLLLELFFGTGFYHDMMFVYGSFALTVLIGFYLRSRDKFGNILTASLLSSVVFFLITNFGTWLMYDIYPKTGSGLAMCYAAGIPFFKGTVTGDLVYNFILFGTYALAIRKFPVLADIRH